jgi:6-phosphogluconolactonase
MAAESVGVSLDWIAQRHHDHHYTEGANMRAYIGTYTHNTASEGIYLCDLNPHTGELAIVGAAPRVENPSYLALHPNGRTLFACGEQTAGAGLATALRIDADSGALSLLNQESTLGPGPCHVSVDHAGRMVMVANYNGGSLAVFPVLSTGALGPASDFYQLTGSGPHPQRQERAHAHSIWPDPSQNWALACDLGSDRVLVYGLDRTNAQLRPARSPHVRVEPGSGPRHLAFHPNQRWVYLLNEIRSAVTLFDWHADRGLLVEVEHVPALPADFEGSNSAADIHLTPNGRFLYASNRGQDALAIFAIDQISGKLTLRGYQPTGGKHPRNFCIDATGRWLLVANMHSDSIVTFRLDAATGGLTPTGAVLNVPSPSCILLA